jgi:hypothetical protein
MEPQAKKALLERVRKRQEEISKEERKQAEVLATTHMTLVYANGIATADPNFRKVAKSLVLNSVLGDTVDVEK